MNGTKHDTEAAGIKSQESGVRGQEPGVRDQESEVSLVLAADS